MEVPQYHQLFNPTLLALRELGGSASIDELVVQVIKDLALPQYVVEKPHGRRNRSELEYRLAWARTYLKSFGLMTNSSRGVWALTADGATATSVDPAVVVRFVREKSRGAAKEEPNNLEESELPRIEDEYSLSPSWRETLIDTLLSLDPAAFERLSQRLLRESGFIEVEVTGRSGDGGIDGHGIIRIAGLISFPVLFQCKRYTGNIGPSIVRDFRGAMIGRAEKGVIITTGGFTREAKAEATRDGTPPIDLIDGDLLADKLKELGLGVRTQMVEEVKIDQSWFSDL